MIVVHDAEIHHSRLRVFRRCPAAGFGLGRLRSGESKNRRRRTSLLVERSGANGGATRVVVDTPPDLREQMLDADVDSLDGVLYTHEHADHTHGIDDLRAFFLKQRRRVDVYLDKPTAASLHVKFGYCFESPPGSDYPPIVTEHRLTAGTPVTVEGQGGPVVALPFRQEHGDIDSLGFRFGKLAYSATSSGLPPESVDALAASTSGLSMRCATGRTRAISRSTTRWAGSNGLSRGAPS